MTAWQAQPRQQVRPWVWARELWARVRLFLACSLLGLAVLYVVALVGAGLWLLFLVGRTALMAAGGMQ